MYIKRVRLKNLRCFEEIEITFDQPGSSLLILGDNNEGKSTLLKSIAIGLCDQSSAAALFRELPGEFVRRKDNVAKPGGIARIEIDLTAEEGEIYRIITRINSLEAFERVSQYQSLFRIRGVKKEGISQDKFPWEQIFVTGYGAGLRTQGTADLQDYLAVDAVYSLFRYDTPLQNPELVIRRLVEAARLLRRDPKISSQAAKKILKSVQRLLFGILELRDFDAIQLTATGIEVEGPWGRSQLGEMGDGYRAIIIWVLDLLSWWFLRESKTSGWEIKDIHGIVLLDEIEQHLHPRWQRYLLSKLKKAFPKIQFIASTHSPLCAASTADLGKDVCQLIRLKQSNGKVEANTIPLPQGFRADQILTSEAFGLKETRNPEVGDKVSRYYKLLLQPKLNNQEQIELKKLRRFITKVVPEAGQFEEEQKLRDELRDLLHQIQQLRAIKKKNR